MGNKKKLVSLGLSAGMLLTSVTAFAAPGDYYIDGDLKAPKYTANAVLRNKNKEAIDILRNPEKFGYEGNNGKIYNYLDVIEAFDKSGGSIDNMKDVLDEEYIEINKEFELKVESVSVINANGVTVEFAALEAAIEGATVEVKNPAGEVVETEAVDIAAEATEATFTFVTALEEVAFGTWTVNGVDYEVVNEELVAAIEAAEAAIEAIAVTPEEVTEIDRTDIEDARALVQVALDLDENAVISNIAKLEALEVALEAATPAVEDVVATVDGNAKEINVEAVLKNIDAETEAITVELMELNEDGDLVALGSPIKNDILTDAIEVDENGKLTTALDVSAIAKADYGDYVVVVTAGDLEVEVDVTVDFTAEDAKVEAVNTAATELQLESVLTENGFVFNPELITEYRAVLGTKAGDNGQITATTVKEIQDKIDEVNDNLANEALAGELKEIATNGTQRALLDALNAAGFKGVEPANIVEYQTYLKGITASSTEKSAIQEKITLTNAEELFNAKNTALVNAVRALYREDGLTNVKEDVKQSEVDAAKTALTEAEEALQALQELDDTNSDTIDVNTQAKIDGAQNAIDEAKGNKEALEAEKVAARTAQADFVKAGGKKGAKVYTELTAAILAADNAADFSALTTAKEAVTDATTALGLYNTAVADANKAIDAHVAAGGTKEDQEVKDLQTELDKEIDWTAADLKAKINTLIGQTEDVASGILGETAALTAETEKLTDVIAAKAAAQTAMDAYVAAGGDITKEAYTNVKTAADELVHDGISTLEGLVTTLENATKELVAVKAINDSITAEDSKALQNEIVKLKVTEFTGLTRAQRSEVGALLIEASKVEGYEAVTATEDFKGVVKTLIGTDVASDETYLGMLNKFNAAANADNGENLITAIENVMDLDELTALEKLNLTDGILNAVDEEGNPVTYAVKTIAEIVSLVSATPLSL